MESEDEDESRAPPDTVTPVWRAKEALWSHRSPREIDIDKLREHLAALVSALAGAADKHRKTNKPWYAAKAFAHEVAGEVLDRIRRVREIDGELRMWVWARLIAIEEANRFLGDGLFTAVVSTNHYARMGVHEIQNARERIDALRTDLAGRRGLDEFELQAVRRRLDAVGNILRSIYYLT